MHGHPHTHTPHMFIHTAPEVFKGEVLDKSNPSVFLYICSQGQCFLTYSEMCQETQAHKYAYAFWCTVSDLKIIPANWTLFQPRAPVADSSLLIVSGRAQGQVCISHKKRSTWEKTEMDLILGQQRSVTFQLPS